ncbi:MAG TPA: chemotaxis protein CheX [Terriglobia bacterium]|nr:chemotaxis protein CheX [Terriglobia bacterium]
MNGERGSESSGRVQLIISAKSSGPGGFTSKLAGLPREEMHQRFTAALEAAAVEVFQMMVGTSLEPADQSALACVADYTAMIGLAGDLCGVLSFRCSSGAAERIAAQMMGTDENISAECIRDALGEICNMVAGSFKAQVSDLAGQCMLSVPTVVSGKDYQMYSLVDGLRIQVFKTFEGALVRMTLDLHNN